MQTKSFIHICIIALLSLTGCAQTSAYRTDMGLCTYTGSGSCPSSAIQQAPDPESNGYYLGFVEFDDQGQVENRNQLQTVLDTYYPLAGKNDVLLVTFIHGWHHSAAPQDGNITSFRGLLSRLSKTEAQLSKKQDRPARQVLGVYIGWRGDSITVPYLNDVTFWERKNTAHKVGTIGVAEALVKLEQIVHVREGMGAPDGKAESDSRMITIGHSFGGAVLFTSLQQILADRFIDSRKGKTYQGDANGFGNLVVLVNPAFEALRFQPLFDLSQEYCRNYPNRQKPRLAILTSEADAATSMAFPAGRFFSTMMETHVDLNRHICTDKGEVKTVIREGEANRHSVGHFEPFLTHRLDPAAESSGPTDYLMLENTWKAQQAGDSVQLGQTRLTHLNKSRVFNPYLNIRVDEAISSGHNDIWGKAMTGFVHDLIVISSMPE